MSVASFVGRVDSKGRITIPLAIRDLLGLYEGVTVSIQADLDARRVVLYPHQPPGTLVRISTECVEKRCVGELIAWLEGGEGVRDIVEVRCYRSGTYYRCYAIASLHPKAVERIKGSGRYRVEPIPQQP